jgi:hypothetical protein
MDAPSGSNRNRRKIRYSWVLLIHRIWSPTCRPFSRTSRTRSIGFIKIHKNYSVNINESPFVFHNVTYANAKSGVPFVAHFIADAGDVPVVHRDGHKVSVPKAAKAALAVSGRCCCETRVAVLLPAFLHIAVVLPGTARILKQIHVRLLSRILLPDVLLGTQNWVQWRTFSSVI